MKNTYKITMKQINEIIDHLQNMNITETETLIEGIEIIFILGNVLKT